MPPIVPTIEERLRQTYASLALTADLHGLAVRIARLARESFKDPRDARQLERAGVGDDEVARDDGGTHAVTAVSQPS